MNRLLLILLIALGFASSSVFAEEVAGGETSVVTSHDSATSEKASDQVQVALNQSPSGASSKAKCLDQGGKWNAGDGWCVRP